MALKFPPPPYLASKDPETQQLNRWLIEIQSILNGAGQIQATAITQPPGDNSTNIATTAFVRANTASNPSVTLPLVDATPAQIGVLTTFARGDHVHPTDTSRAPTASPTFTGSPVAPTQAANDNSTKLATTAYTDSAVGVEKTRALAAEALLAPLASPALTGNPTAPTQATADNSTKIATTAFVDAALLNYGGAVRNGSGVPASGLGNNGDLYLNNTGGSGTRLYGKVSGAWVAIA